jgi:hypothetical protein
MSTDHEFGDEGGTTELPRGESGKSAKQTKLHYTLLNIAALLAMTLPRWVLRRVIRLGELVVVYGEPSCFKTFVVLDIVLRIAFGLAWGKYKTTPGRVVYLAGEGAGGLGKRLLAWATLLPAGVRIEDARFRILPHALAFLSNDEFGALKEALSAEGEKPDVIIVDTLSRYMVGGDENSAQHMGIFVGRCGELRDATGATVIVVHHKGKNALMERGSSALRGAADVMLEVTRQGQHVEIKGVKAKDAELLESVHLTTRVVMLGYDEDGEILSSLVLDPREDPPASDADYADKRDPGLVIRTTLATVFGGEASGNALRDASGLGRTTYYDALKLEIAAGRIQRGGTQKKPTFRLTPKAPEYVSPNPSPDSPEDSRPDSPESRGVSESESNTPLKGVWTDADADSDQDPSSPHQKRRAKKQAADGPARPEAATPDRAKGEG